MKQSSAITWRNLIFNPISLLLFGVLLGGVAKLLDVCTVSNYFVAVLGNILSEFSIWVLFGVIIAVYSKTRYQAMLNIFPFCIGMLIAYYLTAHQLHAVYSWNFIWGWLLFACFVPILAYVVWMTNRPGWVSNTISSLVILFTLLVSVFIFHGLQWYDVFIIIVLIYILFFRLKPHTTAAT